MKRRFATLGSIAFAALLAATLAGAASAEARPDAWVTTKVKLALLTADGVSGTSVHVDTVDGRVTLHGSVPSEPEKTRAAEVASEVDGVHAVRNLLQVVPTRGQDRVAAADEAIEKQVAAALAADPALRDSSIGVQSVHQGVVLLKGKARSLSDTYRAVDTAANVDGVRRVATEIQSPDMMGDEELWRDGGYDAAAYERSSARDTWITTAAKLRLLANGETPGFDINVDTDNRVVTLFGVVPTATARRTAEAEVRKVGGVRNVVNDLQVVAASQKEHVAASDESISKEIEQRLDAHALGDADIDVAVSNGVARLTGTVKSRHDQITALTVARTTTGVTRVIDDLRLATPAVSAR